MVCGLLQQTPEALDVVGDACAEVAPLLDGTVPAPSVAQTVNALNQGQLPPLPLPIAGVVYGSGGGQ
jgi:phospholipid/cholesterol/gamma-HCH transport system substrate-binding protein